MLLSVGLIFSGKFWGVRTTVFTDKHFQNAQINLTGFVNKETVVKFTEKKLMFDEEFDAFLKKRCVKIRKFLIDRNRLHIFVSLPLFGEREITLYEI